VTTALGQLRRSGEVERRPDGTWLLHGKPPQELGHVQERVTARPFREADNSVAD
jgi:hypothetical protein